VKKAFITGVTGQDGVYLSEFLLNKGYEVHGLRRRSSSSNIKRINEILINYEHNNSKFYLHYGDLTDSLNIVRLINEIKPDEIYNLGAMSHVGLSFQIPEYTISTDGIGTLRILEAVRILNLEKRVKIYQASTSELFGQAKEVPQNENTPFYPRSPYGAAKIYAYWITVNYREAYNIFASNGILFNHESPLRGDDFVTRKITKGVSNIVNGNQEKILLGNLNSKRDWGHAKDYVRMMWMILQYESPEDWVISTGKTTSVREFIKLCFKYVGIELEFKGEGVNEKGYVKSCNDGKFNLKVGKEVIGVDKNFFRPTDVDLLIGDSSKALKKLGWKTEFSLNDIVKDMMEYDLRNCKKKSK